MYRTVRKIAPYPGIFIPKFSIHRVSTLVQMTATDNFTTVMGIVAAFGKMNLISSNLPRFLKFSATGILPKISYRAIPDKHVFFLEVPSCSTASNQRLIPSVNALRG